jgi:hypothetical protein
VPTCTASRAGLAPKTANAEFARVKTIAKFI